MDDRMTAGALIPGQTNVAPRVPQLVDSWGVGGGWFRAQRGLIRGLGGWNVWTHELVVSCLRGAWFTD
jgi:hypothetical protein